MNNAQVPFPPEYLIEENPDPIGNGLNPMVPPDSHNSPAQRFEERVRLNSRGQGSRRQSRGNRVTRPRREQPQGGSLEASDLVPPKKNEVAIDMDKGFEDQFNLPENLKNKMSNEIKIVSFGQPTTLNNIFAKPSGSIP